MRQRLDYVLVNRGLVQSRSRARDLIARGAVTVEGKEAQKAGQLVEPDAVLTVDGEANAYVARSGAKLAAGLRGFEFSAAGKVALDVGASTGGFTQVLLEDGAKKVYAVDVGHDQLAAELQTDARVVSLEGHDVRHLTQTEIKEPVEGIVVDVSFISLAQVLPSALSFAAADCWLVALLKPQFEVGRKSIGKGGVVRDDNAVIHAYMGVRDYLEEQGWNVLGRLPSPLPGKKGNEEYLIGATRNGE
ncbi:MAG: TlyA family RNA methyltransferase [Alphaproteobacteria bacterium]|nr:TlyA family RNA methyltransferase [Alphaproteobacteria bacterium]